MTVEEALMSLGGVAPSRVLSAKGVSRWEMDRAVDEGRLIRVRRGVVTVLQAPTDLVTAVSECARLTCISATPYYNLWRIQEPLEVHLSRLQSVGPGCVNHRTRSVPVHRRLPIVGLVDVLVHVLQCRPEQESVPVVECALRRGDTIPAFLESKLSGRRNGRARSALTAADQTGESAIEVVARLILRGTGFDVRAQAFVEGVGRVDFLVEGFLVIEIDGAAFHSDRRALRNDRHRNNMTIINGYLVLRFCYEDVMYHPEEVLATVLSALGPRPLR